MAVNSSKAQGGCDGKEEASMWGDVSKRKGSGQMWYQKELVSGSLQPRGGQEGFWPHHHLPA